MIAIIGIFSAMTLENEEIKAKPKEDEVISNINAPAFNAKGTCKRSLIL